MNINLGKHFLSKGSKDYGDWINSRRVMLDCSQWKKMQTKGKNGRSLSITMLKGFHSSRDKITQALAHEQKKQVSSKHTVG